jgi:hypothetical protein
MPATRVIGDLSAICWGLAAESPGGERRGEDHTEESEDRQFDHVDRLSSGDVESVGEQGGHGARWSVCASAARHEARGPSPSSTSLANALCGGGKMALPPMA